MQLVSPIFSFIQFGQAFDAVPMLNDSDLKFQVVAVLADAAAADALMATEAFLYLVDPGAVITDATSLNAHKRIDFNAADTLQPSLIRVAETKVLVYWDHGLPGFKTVVQEGGCFSLCLVLDGTYHVSNRLTRISSSKRSSVLEYSCDEDSYDFMYCTGFVPNRVRLPLYINRPQLQDDETVYVRSDGSRKLLKSVTKKEYQGVTELLPESWHDKIKVILSHDNISIESKHYSGGISKNGNYEIDWPEFMDFEEGIGKFKVLATPYNWRNSNCVNCQPWDADTDVGGGTTCNISVSNVTVIQITTDTLVHQVGWLVDGTPDSYDYFFSTDGGVTWTAFGLPLVDYTEGTNSITYDPANIGGGSYKVKVVPKCVGGVEGTPGYGIYTA